MMKQVLLQTTVVDLVGFIISNTGENTTRSNHKKYDKKETNDYVLFQFMCTNLLLPGFKQNTHFL